MKLLATFILAQSASNVVVPEANAELDVAHECLVAEARSWLYSRNEPPSSKERWEAAVAIAGECEAQLKAAAQSDGSAGVQARLNHTNLTRHQQIRVEANYYVDRLIREHFERLARERLE